MVDISYPPSTFSLILSSDAPSLEFGVANVYSATVDMAGRGLHLFRILTHFLCLCAWQWDPWVL